MNKARDIAVIAANALEEKKALDLSIIDIDKVSVIADYFVIASGSNTNQIQAMTDEVEERLSKAGFVPKHIEGYRSANWVLMDYGDVIVHIFDVENRAFYNLERIWKDGKAVSKNELTAG